MVQLILRYKVSLTEAIYDYRYCHIKINNCGRGITIFDVNDEDARKIIKDNNLKKVSKDDYEDQKVYNLGRVYEDGKFKKFVNAHSEIKRKLERLINKIDSYE